MANLFAKGRPIEPLVVTAEEREYLDRQVRRHRVSRSLSERCRIILRCADGLQSKVVAVELGIHEHTVGKWRRRFLADRLPDDARPGRPRTIDDDQVAAVIERTLRTTPVDATHWSIRSMAAETGFSRTTIRRMWNAFGLQPHRSQTFKLSSDPLFVDKLRDIVGLYLSPPTRAIRGAGPIAMCGTGRHRCSQRSISPRASSSANATKGTAQQSSSTFSSRSIGQYLAVILDLPFDCPPAAGAQDKLRRRVVGWAVSDRMKKDLAIRALNMAVRLRQPPQGCLFHSDRGSQYCSYD